ncbi:hypothetical protein [Phaeovulum sp. W22_SRMD_FR3]|uniref:hypothetical protein n=1 Tax=Phaeovulum sp. W22_SRMD_FR3 TaxID=3240274 RepID=UPI003F9C3527
MQEKSVQAHNTAQIEPFTLYRAANARNWYGTAPELARETGIALHRVRKILRSRRWHLKPDTLHEETGEPLPLTLEFR